MALPFRVQVHLVASRYGQSPEAVRNWPADDFMDALNFRPVTGDQQGGDDERGGS